MTYLLTFKVAFSALMRTKTRSLLTILGVIIGVGAVIAMVSIGERAKVAKSFESMGTNTLMIRPGSSSRGGVRGGAGSRDTITWEDLKAIRDIDLIVNAAPELTTNAQVLTESSNWSTKITGTESEWFTIRNLKAESGEMFTEIDVSQATKVAVIGKTVSDALFGEGVDPVGEQIRIGHVPFNVIGLAKSRGASAFGSDNDDIVIIPVTTYEQKVSSGSRKYIRGNLLAQAGDAASTASAKAEIEQLLFERHKIADGAEADFQVHDPSEIAAAQAESANTITSLLAGVALVSLLVGGIGIMNIMLVSVTERTREIGLRMAVGAKEAQVLAQFLVEAVVLSLIGGILGIGAGIGAAKYMASEFGFPLVLDVQIMVIAVGVSGLVGIVFGLYPARKASSLDPITALRFE